MPGLRTKQTNGNMMGGTRVCTEQRKGEQVTHPSVQPWLRKRGLFLFFLKMYLKSHLFGLFLHIHNKLFFSHLVLWMVIKDGLVDVLELMLTGKSLLMLA